MSEIFGEDLGTNWFKSQKHILFDHEIYKSTVITK